MIVSMVEVAEQRSLITALYYNIHHHNNILSSDGFALDWFYKNVKSSGKWYYSLVGALALLLVIEVEQSHCSGKVSNLATDAILINSVW